MADLITVALRQQDQMCEGTDKYKNAVESKGDQEQIEISVVTLAHTVAYPGAVMVKPFHTVVTDRAVGGPGWAEYLAGEAVLQLH